MNRSPSDRTLNDLADAVADEFETYRHSDGFNELSIVIDNSDRADRVEVFLRDRGARTQRERHADTDIRVLATFE